MASRRYCVLDYGQEYEVPVGACRSRAHRHVSADKAQELLADGLAEQIYRVWIRKSGKEEFRELPAVRQVRKLTWRAKVSLGGGTGPMKTMQLVAN